MLRTLLMTLTSCFLIPSLAPAQTIIAQPAQVQEPWANKLFGGNTSKDFGVVAKGVLLQGSFEMKNIYKVPLEIMDITPSCGRCVKAWMTKRILNSGETGEIKYTLDTRLFDVPSKSFTIRVRIGPEYISEAMLSLKANARSDVVLNPGSINFGAVSKGATPTQTIDVEYAGAVDWRIDEIIKNGTAPFDLKVQETQRAGQGIKRVGYKLTATIKANAEPGQFTESVLLKTNDPSNPNFSFIISGDVQATLRATPSTVTLNDLKVGEPKELRIVLTGNREFRITDIQGAGKGLSVEKPANPATTHILTLRFLMDQASEMRSPLVIRTDLNNESITVNVAAKAGP